MKISQGDIFFADLSTVVGSEQGGLRPVVVVSNNIMNELSPTIIVVAITAQISEPKLPTHIKLSAKEYGFDRDSIILTEQIRTIDKNRLSDKITRINQLKMREVLDVLKINTYLDNDFDKPEERSYRFILGQNFSKEEDIHYEFKEITGNKPVESIKGNVGKYATSYLNNSGGFIYWGITDDRMIVGVNLNENQKDDVRRIVFDVLNTIRPEISASAFELQFHNIYDVNIRVENLYIVEVKVPAPVDPSTVYFLGGKELYVRVNGSTRIMLGPAITDFILRKNSNRFYEFFQ